MKTENRNDCSSCSSIIRTNSSLQDGFVDSLNSNSNNINIVLNQNNIKIETNKRKNRKTKNI